MARLFLGLGVFLLVLAGWFFYRQKIAVPEPVPIITGAGVELPKENHPFYSDIRPGCPSEIRNLQMEEPYLRGVLEQGTAFQASMNYYQCNQPEKGDVVLYRYSWKFPPVARQVVAVSGDQVQLRKTKMGWEILINGKIHFGGNQKFVFGTPETPPPLFAYIEKYESKIQPGHVVVLSTLPPGDKDSSVFGAVELRDIVGKVIF